MVVTGIVVTVRVAAGKPAAAAEVVKNLRELRCRRRLKKWTFPTGNGEGMGEGLRESTTWFGYGHPVVHIYTAFFPTATPLGVGCFGTGFVLALFHLHKLSWPRISNFFFLWFSYNSTYLTLTQQRSLLPPLDTPRLVNNPNEFRPLVVSPPNRRRSAAGRRRPKVRDGSRNGSGGSVVLRLDHDSDDEGDRRVLSCSNGGATTRAGIDKLGAVAAGQCTMRIGGGDVGSGVGCGGGAGGGGEHEGRPEERLKKRPLAAGGSRKRSKTTPPPPPPPSSSWLALRRALHERYRDSEEHKAAEQTEADARGTNGGRGGWGGEVMSPGLR